ncbi:MAG: winged helix-turn-helix transcriptional regulator [Ignisphaera sp.]
MIKVMRKQYWNFKTIVLSIILLFISMHQTIILSQAQVSSPGIVAYIDPNGLVNIVIKLSLDEGLHEIFLPVEPIPVTITIVRDSEELPLIYEEGRLYIYLDKPSTITIHYIANTTLENNVFYFNIKTPDIIELRISREVILLSWSEENIVDIKLDQGILILMLKGPITISYTLKLPITQTSKTTVIPITPSTPTITISAHESPTLTTPSSTITTSKEFPITMNTIIIAVVVISIGGVILYILFIRRRKVEQRSVLDRLSEVDIAVIKSLEARGGSALQIELQNDINIPKTTLWRHIKKLEKLGIVKVEKIGFQNRVVLVKKIKLT